MICFRRKSFHLFCAFFAFFVVTGDLVADALHDASGVCLADAQDGDHASCPACGCSLHTGAALGFDALVFSLPNEVAASLPIQSSRRPVRAPAEIDHPPQLA